MTNLGFRLAMADQGIEVVETQVGDRYVLEALATRGLALGGEQSGHVIFRRLATTGDGLLTGVQLLDLVARTARPLSALAGRGHDPPAPGADQRRGPSGAIRGSSRPSPATSPRSRPSWGTAGRVLVRPSGTEPVVRVMVEATDETEAQVAAGRLVDAVRRLTDESA